MAIYTLKGKNARIERDTFRAMCTEFGIKPTAIGQILVLKGRTFTVDGMNPEFLTRPFVMKRDDGKRFPIRARTLRAGLTAEHKCRRTAMTDARVAYALAA